eukprot:12346162-Ditylum_brightwellii.AAC.1
MVFNPIPGGHGSFSLHQASGFKPCNFSGGLQNIDASSYVSAEDSDYVPGAFVKEEDTLADAVSLLLMDDDYSTAESHTSCFKS